MIRPAPEDPAELRALGREVHRRLSMAHRGAVYFSPIAIVCSDLLSTELRNPRHDQDERITRGLYTLGHETVHLIQTITTAWVFDYARKLADLLLRVTRGLSTGSLSAKELADSRTELEALRDEMCNPVDDFSARQVIECHAILEGVWGVMANPTEEKVVCAARLLHQHDGAEYNAILDRMVAEYGPVPAVHLTPRLCAIALQSNCPGGVMSDMLAELRKCHDIGPVVFGPIEQLVESVTGVGWEKFVPSRKMRTGDNSSIDSRLWEDTFIELYYRAFDDIPVAEQLRVMMHPGQNAEQIRRILPMYTLFRDGEVQCSPLVENRNVTDYSNWLRIGATLLDSLDTLSK